MVFHQLIYPLTITSNNFIYAGAIHLSFVFVFSNRSVMTHSTVPPDEKLRRGITDNLFRVSVSLENADDLMDDLKKSLDLLGDLTAS